MARDAAVCSSRARRRHRRRRSAGDEDGRIEAAQQRGKDKADAANQLLTFAIVVGALMIFMPRIAWIVGLIWGLSIAGDVAKRLIEPELRRRWIDREVRRELDQTVRAERDRLQDDHSRNLEELAAGVAQEIRDPIAAAKELVQQMGEDPAAHGNVEHAGVALEELSRVERSISHLLRFARDENANVEPTAISEILLAACGALRERAHDEGVVLAPEIDAAGEMVGDPKQLAQAVANLVARAIETAREVREPRVDLHCGENLGGTEVWLRIRDNGPRPSEDALRKLWSPFQGIDDHQPELGLAYTKKVVDAHGGTIAASAPRSGGTEFLVTFHKHRSER